MLLKVLGVGAAGNKAAATLIDEDVLTKEHVKLLNTTLKDVPNNYKELAVQFASDLGGCGKEPREGRKAMIKAIRNNSIDLEGMIEPDTQMVIIVASTEGGTGCGSTPVLVRHFLDLNMTVHVYAFLGFNDDVRGIKNTLAFFKELDDDVVLHTIKNSAFLDYSNSHKKAEVEANKEFAKQIRVLAGSDIISSEQNIDDKDIYKLRVTPGYMDIQRISLQGVKNKDQFNKVIENAYDNVTCLDFDPTSTRLGCIINASEKTVSAIDDNFEAIKRYVGEPFEVFRHIQFDPTQPEYIDIMSCGMGVPEKGITDINTDYREKRSKLSRDRASLKDVFKDIAIDDDDDEFDIDVKKIRNEKKDPSSVSLTLNNVDYDEVGDEY